MKKLILSIAVLAHLTLAAQTIEEFISYSFHYNLVSSPDLARPAIAFVENKEGVRNLFLMESTDGSPMALTAFTKDDGQDLGDIAFTDSVVYFVRGSAPNRAGEFPNPTTDPDGAMQLIYKVSRTGGTPIPLVAGTLPTPYAKGFLFLSKGTVWYMDEDMSTRQLFTMRGNASDLRLSPDHSQLAFISNRGDHSFACVYQFADSSLRILDPTVDQDRSPVWSPDGSQLAWMRFPHESPMMFTPQREGLPFGIVVYDFGQNKVVKTWTADSGKGSVYRLISAADQLMWMANGQLVFAWEKDGWTHLHAFSPSTGMTTLLTPGPFEVQYVSIAPDRRSIVFSSNLNDLNRQHIWQITNDLKLSQLTKGATTEWSPIISGDQVFTLGSAGREPASVKRIDGTKLMLIKGSPGYSSNKLIEPQEITYAASDGMVIHAQLFQPTDIKKGEQRPAVIFMHGGSRRQMLAGFHHRDYYHYFYAMNQYLVSKGYVVLAINYRSGIGYGMEFREAQNYGAAGASEFNDVLGAGLYLRNLDYVDPDRIGLYGGSYGGYLTAMGLSRASDLFAAGVDIHGVMDWNEIIQGFQPNYNRLMVPEFAKLAYESSPIASMDTWRSPVLLIHGDDDRNVPFSETVDKIEQLRKNGVYFEQLIFPDEVHGFLLHNNWLKAFEATFGFFERKMK